MTNFQRCYLREKIEPCFACLLCLGKAVVSVCIPPLITSYCSYSSSYKILVLQNIGVQLMCGIRSRSLSSRLTLVCCSLGDLEIWRLLVGPWNEAVSCLCRLSYGNLVGVYLDWSYDSLFSSCRLNNSLLLLGLDNLVIMTTAIILVVYFYYFKFLNLLQ